MFKKITLLLFSSLVIFAFTSSVKAEKISYKKIDGVYYNQLVNGKWESNYVTMFYFGNVLAYCIEPGVDINTSDYNSSKDWSQTSFSKEQQEQLEKIGYYGYEYPGHQTPEYYLAAQELIWEVSNPNVEVYWSSGKDGSGNRLNYDKEKEEILRLIEEDSLRPSFSESLISGEVGETFTINDINNVLSNYSISESKYHDLKIENNQLIITLNKELVEKEKITLTRKNYDNGVLLVYTKGNSQKLATLRFSSPVETYFEIENQEKPEVPETPETPETPEIVKVPNTGISNSTLLPISLILGGFILRVKKTLQ